MGNVCVMMHTQPFSAATSVLNHWNSCCDLSQCHTPSTVLVRGGQSKTIARSRGRHTFVFQVSPCPVLKQFVFANDSEVGETVLDAS